MSTAKEIAWEQDDRVTKDNRAEINCASIAIGTCRHCVNHYPQRKHSLNIHTAMAALSMTHI